MTRRYQRKTTGFQVASTIRCLQHYVLTTDTCQGARGPLQDLPGIGEVLGMPPLTAAAHVASRQFGRHPGGPHFKCRTCIVAGVLLNLVQHEAESAVIGPAVIDFVERADHARAALSRLLD